MQSGLPNTIQPRNLVAEGAVLEGVLALNRMERLCEMLASTEGQVSVCLKAGVDPDGISYLGETLETTVTVICQRCMEPLAMPLRVESQLGLISDEAQADSLPAHYEPLVSSEEPLSLTEIVEDELILALPFSPRCADPSVCGRAPALGEPSTGPENKPFEALSVLLNKSKRKE